MPGFWESIEGVIMRLALLADNIIWGDFNEAIIQISTSQLRALDFQVMGPLDEITCPICAPQVGTVQRLGEFMIELPAHPNCRHWWDIYQPGQELM